MAMYSPIKTFVNEVAGDQYLFTQADFHLLQTWIAWMAINHQHTVDSTGEAMGVPASHVIMHDDVVHSGNPLFRPIGWETATLSDRLVLSQHVSNAAIHAAPGEAAETAVVGQLIARGWTDPIKVSVVISLPLFECIGFEATGSEPMFLPFPHLNMAPLPTYAPNYLNAMDVSTSYISSSPVDPDLVHRGFTGGSQTWAKNLFYPQVVKWDTDALFDPDALGSPEYLGVKYPYIQDAKARGNSHFLNEFHQFLYAIPPNTVSNLKLKIDLDRVVGGSIDTSAGKVGYFLAPPLFIDVRHTRLLDRVERSGITIDEILNFRDLVHLFPTDAEKVDLFNTQADHTCWMTKYTPILVDPETESTQVDKEVFLFFNDFTQEINQFLSQANYPSGSEGTQVIPNNTQKGYPYIYWDWPFKTVTVDFSIYSDMSVFDNYESIMKLGFPACFYNTDFSHTLVEAGGHNRTNGRPNESFSFDIFVDGLIKFKEWFSSEFKDLLPGFRHYELFDYFDKLNVPSYFDDGQRQVLILKDQNLFRQEKVFKRNPFSNMRSCAYQILDGYISIPYEAYYMGTDTGDMGTLATPKGTPLSPAAPGTPASPDPHGIAPPPEPYYPAASGDPKDPSSVVKTCEQSCAELYPSLTGAAYIECVCQCCVNKARQAWESTNPGQTWSTVLEDAARIGCGCGSSDPPPEIPIVVPPPPPPEIDPDFGVFGFWCDTTNNYECLCDSDGDGTGDKLLWRQPCDDGWLGVCWGIKNDPAGHTSVLVRYQNKTRGGLGSGAEEYYWFNKAGGQVGGGPIYVGVDGCFGQNNDGCDFGIGTNDWDGNYQRYIGVGTHTLEAFLLRDVGTFLEAIAAMGSAALIVGVENYTIVKCPDCPVTCDDPSGGYETPGHGDQ